MLSNFFIFNNLVWNNYVPTLYSYQFKVKMFYLGRQIIYNNFSKYFTFFIGSFLEIFLKNSYMLRFTFFKNKKINFILKYQTKKLMRHQFWIGRGFFLNEMLFVIWTSFQKKDLLFLVLWIKRTMERIQWKKQKAFLQTLRFVLKNSVTPYFKYLNCLGYQCTVWGKIGVTGNAKTRGFTFKNKYYSLTTKENRLDFESTTINTHTGVLGLSFYLIF